MMRSGLRQSERTCPSQFGLKVLFVWITALAVVCALISWGTIGGVVLALCGTMFGVTGVAAAVAFWRTPQRSELTLGLIMWGIGVLIIATGVAVVLAGSVSISPGPW